MKADLLIRNANEIITADRASYRPKTGKYLQDLGILKKSDVAIKNGRIVDVGFFKWEAEEVIDATNKIVLPGFVDCHTHLVFAGSRSFEYEAKTAGSSYAGQHKTGGILYTVEQTRKASLDELVKKGLKDLDVMLRHGTTTVEIKSGYGLDEENELKILRVIKELQSNHPMTIMPTFLGAHTVPQEYKNDREGYVDLVKRIIPKIRRERLAEYCDVFCDKLGFTYKESKDILQAAKKEGLDLKIHAEQTGHNYGARLAAKLKAVSADHLDYATEKDVTGMIESKIIGVLLPGVTYHLTELIPGHKKLKKFLPAKIRGMIEQGLPVALATDYNPGSCNTQSMKTVMETAARLYRMSYAEIINASTINAAHALKMAHEIGSIEIGKKADLVVYDCEEHGMLIDNFGVNLVDTVIKDGKIVYKK
ncbi:imidazolonepropionase [Candidatus Woesearchaeota archaeon]|nr:imidazolonepropionase [Candidatus Woesearchaeota archaeon]